MLKQKNGKKTITNAVIIDGAIKEANEIMKLLYSIKWEDRYKNVSFVPFRASQTLTTNDQKEAMEFHSDYLNSTYRKLVRIANPNKQYEIEGEKITFREWIIQSQLHGQHMIDGVETMKDDIVRIIYDKKIQKGVDYIMNNLQNNVLEVFGETIADDMLGDDYDIVTHFSSDLEDQHAQKIKSAWQGKQTHNVTPPKQQHKLYMFRSRFPAGFMFVTNSPNFPNSTHFNPVACSVDLIQR